MDYWYSYEAFLTFCSLTAPDPHLFTLPDKKWSMNAEVIIKYENIFISVWTNPLNTDVVLPDVQLWSHYEELWTGLKRVEVEEVLLVLLPKNIKITSSWSHFHHSLDL